ncbi:sulfotransferase [Tateyamaria omphalii]|uniref:sulfotransferase family protein n=1 Tax=Tateyamaria omphalii TaxID=299262 RepID=UPI001C99B311|nr:sulfotransferase [Tateyamaria omphalii]MBY5935525.1 sulfotransferase [Tateyamaria omphalii]
MAPGGAGQGSEREDDKRLGFFVVGAQKAGTTALFAKLTLHPGIAAPARKELHFFDKNRTDWTRPEYSALHTHFEGADPALLWGEATPIYMFWPDAMARLAAYNPAARLIVMLRHPVYRAVSHWKMSRYRGHDPLSFEAAIAPDSAALRPAVKPVEALRKFTYVERGFYAPQITRMLDLFPRDQVLFLRMEDLACREAATLARTFDFLGLPDHPMPAEMQGARIVPVPSGDAEEMPPRAVLERLAQGYHDDIRATATLTGLDLSDWLDPHYREPGLT